MKGTHPKVENLPQLAYFHRPYTIEGWSRAGIQSYWRIPELGICFDLGGIPWNFHQSSHWFISHPHIDHLAALPMLLARRMMMRMPPPKVYVPHGVVGGVQHVIDAWKAIDHGDLACDLIGISPNDNIAIDDMRVVRAFPTEHPVESCGYLVSEKRHRLRAEFRNLPSHELVAAKKAGSAIEEEFLVPMLCYTGDTAEGVFSAEPNLFLAKILLIECSFLREEHDRVKIHRFGHLHLDDFVERADQFQNELIILMHHTSRDEPAFFASEVKRRLPASLSSRMICWGASDPPVLIQ
ncbi:MAG: MBL fold metallo-hydrolase [Zavarzinella sp.]